MKRYFVLLGLAVGVTVIIGVAAIVMLHSEKSVVAAANAAVADEGPMPELGGAVAWLNSTPLSRESLRGKVVLVNFWTYSCINSLRELPYIKSWAAKYKDAGLDASTVRISAEGAEAPPSDDVRSPETYVGYARAEKFASPGGFARDSVRIYSVPARPSLNQWGLGGSWNVGAESAVLQQAPGKIAFRFHSRDLHMVLAPPNNGKPVRFRVKLDGAAPGEDHGVNSNADGAGEIRQPRMYQLIRQKGGVRDRLFEIEFLDPGAQAFSFTFG